MKFEEFERLIMRLEKTRGFYEKLMEYPSDYQDAILDNPYVNDTLMVNDFLLQKLLPDHYDCLSWWMYEWKPGFTVRVDDKEYVIMDVDDYLKFKEETWSEE